jgi:thymidylate kinase
LIINIRGTHGSGKSTLAQQLLKKYKVTPEQVVGQKRPLGYKLRIPDIRKPLYIVGPYTTACGGCDAIQPYDLIWPRVELYAKKGHVFFEGALVSSSVGEIGRAMALRKDCVVLFLDTPLKTCLSRIQKRRTAKGDDRPLNPRNTTVKHLAVERSKPKLEALGLRCLTLKHKNAFKEMMEVLLENSKS